MQRFQQISPLPRRAVLLGSIAALVGCAAKPILFDRTSMNAIKQVGLPTIGFPAYPTVDVVNAIGKRLGVIGLVTTAVVSNNRVDALTALMTSKGFDPRAFFKERLIERVQASGLNVVIESGGGARHDFIERYPDAYDATLDVVVSHYGYIAASDYDNAPYRPSAAVSMRLVQTRGRSVLMQDKVALDMLDFPLPAATGGPAIISFETFAQVTAHPDLAIAGLQGALAYAAEAVGKRLA